MTIYIINGWTPDVGMWQLEAFRTKEEAIKQFSYYVDQYTAIVTDKLFYKANCCGGGGHFWIEEVRV